MEEGHHHRRKASSVTEIGGHASGQTSPLVRAPETCEVGYSGLVGMSEGVEPDSLGRCPGAGAFPGIGVRSAGSWSSSKSLASDSLPSSSPSGSVLYMGSAMSSRLPRGDGTQTRRIANYLIQERRAERRDGCALGQPARLELVLDQPLAHPPLVLSQQQMRWRPSPRTQSSRGEGQDAMQARPPLLPSPRGRPLRQRALPH